MSQSIPAEHNFNYESTHRGARYQAAFSKYVPKYGRSTNPQLEYDRHKWVLEISISQ